MLQLHACCTVCFVVNDSEQWTALGGCHPWYVDHPSERGYLLHVTFATLCTTLYCHDQ